MKELGSGQAQLELEMVVLDLRAGAALCPQAGQVDHELLHLAGQVGHELLHLVGHVLPGLPG